MYIRVPYFVIHRNVMLLGKEIIDSHQCLHYSSCIPGACKRSIYYLLIK